MFRALSIFTVTYLFMSKPHWPFVQLDRPIAGLIGAVLMIAAGVLTPGQAYDAVDWDTIVLLLGMFLLSGSLRLAGFFEWAAGIVLTHVHTPTALLTALVVVSGLLSALLVNDTVARGIGLEIQQSPVLSETVATGGFPARGGDKPRPAAVHG